MKFGSIDVGDNSDTLRDLIENSGLTQLEALARFNRGQAKPMALRTLKSYLASHDARTRINCSDSVLERMRKVLKCSNTSNEHATSK